MAPVTNDFSFLVGSWTIRHSRLKESMTGCADWTTFETRYEAWVLLGGAASVDRVYGALPKRLRGVDLRAPELPRRQPVDDFNSSRPIRSTV